MPPVDPVNASTDVAPRPRRAGAIDADRIEPEGLARRCCDRHAGDVDGSGALIVTICVFAFPPTATVPKFAGDPVSGTMSGLPKPKTLPSLVPT